MKPVHFAQVSYFVHFMQSWQEHFSSLYFKYVVCIFLNVTVKLNNLYFHSMSICNPINQMIIGNFKIVFLVESAVCLKNLTTWLSVAKKNLNQRIIKC